MLMDTLIRFVVGGVVVSVFAMLGDLVKPKSFAGLFGAAPSVAMATIFLTLMREGRAFMAIEAHSMIAGAIAFFVYSCIAAHVLYKGKWSALRVTSSTLLVWAGAATGLWLIFLR
jgi:hypothetical protein